MSNASVSLGSDVLEAVVEAAQHAGAILVQMQTADQFGTKAKGDGSPVTLADRAAHDILVSALPRIAQYLVVSEESAPHENMLRREQERVWIVDPLDGTREYIRGSDQFTVNVALVENGVPILGVIVAPRLGLTYFAQRGNGAFRRSTDGITQRMVARRMPVDADRIVVSGSDIGVTWSRTPSLAGIRVEAISSCVKLGFVAEGSAIAYPRVTPSSEWDIAAGHAIVTEAGGRVIGVDGDDLRYNKVDPLNTAFVATADPQIAADYASILRT